MDQLPDLRPDSAVKPDRWAQFRGLSPWQAGGTYLPLVLIVFGGLLGGLAGGAATMINLKIARSGMAPAVQALAMVGVVLGAAITYFLAAALLSAALG
ncbi:hypothetical protein ABZ479_12245 [Streptomyces sp. NPDC005722]